ncbi:unnamed protein product [Ceratitis capitata]|uniref:(Mediterranean fruit fly) hypothetical protein n=1 Tax=Ceratitis capitata TaxID=7213 RepID=A0A811UUC3_CERCA|nr:unnamed protein product [Ceratitis capitata]
MFRQTNSNQPAIINQSQPVNRSTAQPAIEPLSHSPTIKCIMDYNSCIYFCKNLLTSGYVERSYVTIGKDAVGQCLVFGIWRLVRQRYRSRCRSWNGSSNIMFNIMFQRHLHYPRTCFDSRQCGGGRASSSLAVQQAVCCVVGRAMALPFSRYVR